MTRFGSEKKTGVLILEDGSIFYGTGYGAETESIGEVCFNTAMTGYQEILTDPSYAAQIITFTFPHIGNTGTNTFDIETVTPVARGLVTREVPTDPSNWRSDKTFDDWLKAHNIVGIAGIDTRALTTRIRDHGAPKGIIAHSAKGAFDLDALKQSVKEWPGLDGMDLAKDVCCRQRYNWDESTWDGAAYGKGGQGQGHIVAIDYGAKRNILRNLSRIAAKVTVVPASATAEDILALKPDGIFLSNGPGDPAATGQYAVPVIQELLKANLPIFGICLGHQMLALALGGKTRKMHLGHRGANHPVQDIQTGKVEITSQNHGFEVLADSLPAEAEITHISLFDKTNEGFRLKDKPVFSVQYHPEASPGPEDSHYLFDRFAENMRTAKSA